MIEIDFQLEQHLKIEILCGNEQKQNEIIIKKKNTNRVNLPLVKTDTPQLH